MNTLEALKPLRDLEALWTKSTDAEETQALEAGIKALWLQIRKSGWEVLQASCSERNGGLYVSGINHEVADPRDREFHWHINVHGINDSRFDFSGCVFAEGAQARLERMQTKGY